MKGDYITHSYGKWTLPLGWYFRETPGHGYLHPSSDDNAKVPDFIRSQSYEEDCDWAIPIVFNRELFPADCYEAALETFKNWHPKEYEKAFNVVLCKGESYKKDQYYFRRIENIGNYEKSAGFGDWCFDVPKGKVYAHLRKITRDQAEAVSIFMQGEEITCLMPTDVYQNNDCFSLDQVELYKRDETYYTWEAYTKATGKERYK